TNQTRAQNDRDALVLSCRRPARNDAPSKLIGKRLVEHKRAGAVRVRFSRNRGFEAPHVHPQSSRTVSHMNTVRKSREASLMAGGDAALGGTSTLSGVSRSDLPQRASRARSESASCPCPLRPLEERHPQARFGGV